MTEPTLFSEAPTLFDGPAQSPLTDARPPERTPSPDGIEPFEYWATPILPGRTLVEASAGTGKTFAIAGLVLRLVLDGDWLAATPGGPPDLRRLLVVTFTKAATEELKTRIRAALRLGLAVARDGAEPDALTRPLLPLLQRPDAPDRLLAALDRVDEAGVHTIHGFCKRVLEAAAFESGTPFEMEFVEDADSDALRARAAADAWARLVHGDAQLAALVVQRGHGPATLVAHHKAVADFPSVRILPEAPSLDEAREAFRQRLADLAEVWDADALCAAMDGIDWNKTAPLVGDGRAAVLARVAAFVRGDDLDGLPAVRACTPEAVWTNGSKAGEARKAALRTLADHPGLQACAAVAEAADRLDAAFVRAFVLDVADRIEAIKAQRGQLTFSDLITRLHAALHDGGTGAHLTALLRQQVGVALIDEFQDTDPLQYAIFRTAFEGRPLVFVGDPKQAIYAFRGADVHAYLGAQREADRVFTLGTNWRSTAGLVEAVNAVFSRPARPFLFDGIPFRPVRPAPAKSEPRLVDGDASSGSGQALPPLVWWPMPTGDGRPLGKTAVNKEIPGIVAAEVHRLLGEGRMRTDGGERPLDPSDIAVLVPTRYEAAEVLKALQAAGVPAIVSRADDVRRSTEIHDVELVLRAVLRPDDERAVRAALATELWGWTAAHIASLDDDPDRLARVLRDLRDGQKAWRRHGVLHVLTNFQQRERVLERLLAYPDGERRVTNLRHTAELLHELEAGGDRSPEDLLHWLRHRAEAALPSSEMKELRLERDAAAVTITTHHNAKGLEYEVVFLPYLWSLSERDTTKGETVLARTPDGVVYDLGSPEQDAAERLRQVDNLAEHVRKAYVALTRARERCYVVWGPVLSSRRRLDPLCGLGYLLCGHGAESGASLADHVEAARLQAATDDPLAPLAALDPEGRWMAVVTPPAPLVDGLRQSAVPAPGRERGASAARALPDGTGSRVTSPWKTASFSAWTAGRSSGLAGSDEPAPAAAREAAVPAGIHAFAAGTAPGTCLHQILQHADWREGEHAEAAAEANRETVTRLLGRYGLAGSGRPHRAALDAPAEVLAMLRRVAAVPLFGENRLADAASGALLPEWPFTFPLGRVAPATLAEAFREHGSTPFGSTYADAVSALTRDAIDGLMTGEVDLVAHVGERWWVVDWKSNRLGPDDAAYVPDALERTMHEHHYGLQLHLYTVGLHRFLRSRLGAAYDYDVHIGGATYVFLRGLDDAGSGVGLARHRPSAALVEALDRLLSPDA